MPERDLRFHRGRLSESSTWDAFWSNGASECGLDVDGFDELLDVLDEARRYDTDLILFTWFSERTDGS
jgi:hypothetical protein